MSRERWKLWSGLLAKFATAQALVQLFGVVSGLCLIRALPTAEYAWFTLASGWLGTLAVLADTGISMAFMAIGGRVYEDRSRLARLVAECIRLRKALFVIAAVVVIPLLGSLLRKSGAPWLETLLLCGLVAGISYWNLNLSIYAAVPRLCAQYDRVLRFDVGGAALRLGLIGLTAWLLPYATLPIVVTGVVILIQRHFVLRWVQDTVPLDLSARSEDRSAILSLMKSHAPNAVYYCLQGQVSLVLITWLGQTEQVAEVGALGRLALMFSVFMGVVGALLAPLFARGNNPLRLFWQYGLIVGAFCGLGGLFLGAAQFFPQGFLIVLGSNYFHLEKELYWMVLSIVASNIVAAMWKLNSSRGWIRHMWIEIPLSIAIQALSCLWLDLSTVSGVLILGCIASISSFLVNAFLSYNGFRALFQQPLEPSPKDTP